MEIKINNNKKHKPTFYEVKFGDLFAECNNNELYVKIHKHNVYNCVAIRTGQLLYCPDDNKVRLVKSINVDLEDQV